MRKTYFTILFTFLTVHLFAQLQTSGGMGASQLVQNVLLGGGVAVSNVHYYGSTNAIGTFDGSNTNIGLNGGIIMTTGTIHNTPGGPFGPNNMPDAGVDNGYAGYAPLTNLVGTSTFNSAVLEFDFVPYSDSVKFKYVFASEEYPEYVGSKFNDVFAFFISGPGISGTKNMAIIPGTSQPVAINNVNDGNPNPAQGVSPTGASNPMFYVDNGNGAQAPYNGSPYYVQYDGFTVPLEAVSKVQCGKKYHLIIALADVGDGIWDSGIFLDKNSLTSDQPVKVDYQLTSNPYGDGVTMAQNCTSAIVTITRSGSGINSPLDIPVTLSGSAVEGVDYSNVPTNIHFNAGQTTVTFTIDALNNPSLSGTVDLILHFDIVNACGEHVPQTIELHIKPVEPVAVSVDDGIVACPGDSVQLVADATGGGGGYTYSWSTGETTDTIFVSPNSTQNYSVSVTDECLIQTATATAQVTVPTFTPLVIDATDDISVQCPFIPNSLNVEATGASGDYTYTWFNDTTGAVISGLPSVDVDPYSTTHYTVVVTDRCGESDTAHVAINVLSPPLLLSINPTQEVCPGDSVHLTVTPTGGFGNYHYLWPQTGDTTQSIWVNPDSTYRYDVIVKDDCQTFQVNTHTIVKVVKPRADFDVVTDTRMEGFPITFQNKSTNATNYFWDFGDGHSSTMTHPNNTYDSAGTYYVELFARDQRGCLDSILKPIVILKEAYLYVPNTFTPNGNRNNNIFRAVGIGIKEFRMTIYNRWGELIFESKDINTGWDGSYGKDNLLCPIGTYVWKIDYKSVNDKDTRHKVGHVNLVR